MSKLKKPLDSWLMNMVTFDYFVMNFNSIVTCKNNFFVKNTQSCRPILLFETYEFDLLAYSSVLTSKTIKSFFFLGLKHLNDMIIPCDVCIQLPLS